MNNYLSQREVSTCFPLKFTHTVKSHALKPNLCCSIIISQIKALENQASPTVLVLNFAWNSADVCTIVPT
jgi:hypothetical protein